MSHVVILDNYDSFTFNLAQAFAAPMATAKVDREIRVSVRRNDAVDLNELLALAPDYLVLSPGPGGPGAPGGSSGSGGSSNGGTGLCAVALHHYRGQIPILGVCLGHQILAESFGLEVSEARVPVHGKAWNIQHSGEALFRGLPQPLRAARYHSLVVRAGAEDLRVRGLHRLAWTDGGEIMALGVSGERTWGVQFHPESYLTPDGPRLLANFLGSSLPVEPANIETSAI